MLSPPSSGAPEAILDNVERRIFQIPFRLDESAEHLRKLMRKYRGSPMDLADACLVRLADALQTGLIVTLDRDFVVYRWGRQRTFDNLIGWESLGPG